MDKRLPKAVQTYFYAKNYEFLSLVEIYSLALVEALNVP